MAQSKPPSGKTSTTPRGSAPKGRPGTPAKGKAKPKSIVNQKQTPWGIIAAAVAVVLFAAAVVIVVVATRKSGSDTASGGGASHVVNASDAYRQPELPAAKAIKGVTYIPEGDHEHVTGTVKYDRTPPAGGNHSQIWADCTGKVYATQLANENAVHALEHGAVWITYNPATVSAAQVKTLTSEVQAAGKDRWLITPFKGLKTPVSLQSWGYQLFVPSVTDARITQFVTALSANQKTWPEQGATCSDPAFNPKDSTPGHPQENA